MKKGPWGLMAGLGVVGLGLVLATAELRRQRGRLDALEARLAAFDRTAERRPAGTPAPAVPATLPATAKPHPSAPAVIDPHPADGTEEGSPSRPATTDEIRKAVQEILKEREVSQETDWLVDSWDWDSVGAGLVADPTLAAQMKSVWEEYGRQIKVLSDQAKGDPAARRALAEKADEFQRSFYEQFRASLDLHQLASIKSNLADMEVDGYMVIPAKPGTAGEGTVMRVPSFPYEEAEALGNWNWSVVPKRLNLAESLRPHFDDALRQLHDLADRMRGDPGMVPALRLREKEIRQAFLDQVSSQLTPDQLDRLKRRFQSLDPE